MLLMLCMSEVQTLKCMHWKWIEATKLWEIKSWKTWWLGWVPR